MYSTEKTSSRAGSRNPTAVTLRQKAYLGTLENDAKPDAASKEIRDDVPWREALMAWAEQGNETGFLLETWNGRSGSDSVIGEFPESPSCKFDNARTTASILPVRQA